jgi:type IV pilus assembly protein PilW
MVAMTLGLFIVLTVTGLLLSSKTAYIVQDQSAHVQETGRYAMEILSRAIRQAGYENWSSEWMPALATVDFSPNVMGMDAMTLKKTTAGLDAPVSTFSDVVNGSDILALRCASSAMVMPCLIVRA